LVQIRPAEISRFLTAPTPAIRVVLFYGPDDGLVAERAEVFCRAVVGRSDDPFALVRLESNEIIDDPGRLADEAKSVPLFGGQRAVLLRHSGSRSINASIEALLESPPEDSWVAITAGELRKDAPLRRLCEKHKGAAAIACYADSGRDLDQIIDEEFSTAGLAISGEARALLQSLIGSDRLASRSEIRKLCLYATDVELVGIDEVRAVVGDASAFALDECVDALALGDAAEFDRSFRQLIASGTPGFVVAGATQRHFGFLHLARAACDQGTLAKEIVARARPPIFFKRQSQVERQIALWPRPRIERALAHLDQAVIESRFRGAISDVVIGQALSLVATVAARLRRSRVA
jgi:DNA polymerase III subunit delta